MNPRSDPNRSKQPAKIPKHLFSGCVGEPRLHSQIHPYRVMVGDRIVGQFSNILLVRDAVRKRPAAVACDVSMVPSRVIYKDGQWTAGTIQ